MLTVLMTVDARPQQVFDVLPALLVLGGAGCVGVRKLVDESDLRAVFAAPRPGPSLSRRLPR